MTWFRSLFWKNESGATAVEMAILVPLFMLVMFAILDLGRMQWIRHELQFAVEQASRFALVNPSAGSADIEEVVQNNLTFGDSEAVAVEALNDVTDDVSFVSIDATYNFAFFSGYVDFGETTLRGYIRTPRQ